MKRNNPIYEALAEAHNESVFKDRKIGCLVSIGTGVPEIGNVPSNLLGFLAKAVSMMTDAEDIADDFAKSGEGQRLAEGNAYFRFNVPQGLQQLKLDDWKEVEKMRALTTEYLKKAGNGREVERCAASLLNPGENRRSNGPHTDSLLRSYSCQHFVARPEYQKVLEDFFAPMNACKRRAFALWGMSGAGKTQIALHFAHEAAKRTRIFWVRADPYASFINDFTEIFGLLNPKMKEAGMKADQRTLLDDTKRALEQCTSSWIIILDNADDLDKFIHSDTNPEGIDKYLPKTGLILVTTQDHRFQGAFASAKDGLEVKMMSDEQAEELLTQSLPPHISHHLQDSSPFHLLSELGNHPLAIAQAAVNMVDYGMDFDQYTSEFRRAKKQMPFLRTEVRDLLSDDPHTRTQSICTNWELAYAFLKQKHPLSATLLEYLSTLHWTRIPTELLRDLPEFQNLSLLEFQDVLKQLRHRALINDNAAQLLGNEYDLHPLLHYWITEKVAVCGHSKELILAVIGVMTKKFPYFNPSIISNSGVTVTKLVGSYLIPHASRLVQLGTMLELRTGTFCCLLQLVGLWHSSDARPRVALDLISMALEISTSVNDFDDHNRLLLRIDFIQCLYINQSFKDAVRESTIAYALISQDFATRDPSFCLVWWKRVFVLLALCLYRYNREVYHLFMKDQVNQLDEQGLEQCAWIHHATSVIWLDQKDDYRVESQHLNTACIEYAKSKPILEMTLNEQRLYLDMIKLKASINITPKEAPELRDLSQKLSYLCFTKSQELFGPANIGTWESVARFMHSAIKDQPLTSLKFCTDFLRRAADLEFEPDEGFRRCFARLYCEILRLNTMPRVHRVKKARYHLQETLKTLETMLERYRISPNEGQMQYPYRYGTVFQLLRRFEEAENAFNWALVSDSGLASARGRARSSRLHYEITLAIAGQPGRLDEALQYRMDRLDSIKPIEEIYGCLEDKIRLLNLEKPLYEQAREMRDSGKLSFQDQWWQKHEKELERAEMRYGMLFFFDDSEFDNAELAVDDEEMKSLRKEYFGE